MAPVATVRMATERQIDYVKILGGDAVHAAKLTKLDCSKYIDELKAKGGGRTVHETDPRLAMIVGLIDQIPHGYFAVQKESGAAIDFIRISRPKPGAKTRFAGSTKFQTQHGPRLEVAGVLWPSGQFSIYDHRLPELLLQVVADYRSCAMLYAEKIGQCMRCNAELTDDRSRFYGIGPECENYWTWAIEAVAERKGMTFEQAKRRGLINIS